MSDVRLVGLGAELRNALGAEVWGIELVGEVAEKATQRLDKVINRTVEDAIPLLPDRHFDAIILADVLEHLQDPFFVLEHIKEKLADKGEIVASIPNVRHWSVLKGLLEGRWDYQEAGILDRTHLRFFTRTQRLQLFNDAGFDIKEMKATTCRALKYLRT